MPISIQISHLSEVFVCMGGGIVCSGREPTSPALCPGGGVVPDNGFIVHLHNAVGITAASAARQTGEGRADRWGPSAGPPRQLWPSARVLSDPRKKTAKVEASSDPRKKTKLRHPVLGWGLKAPQAKTCALTFCLG